MPTLKDVCLSSPRHGMLFYHGRLEGEQTSFVTPDDALLQVGQLVFPEGHVVKRHRHVLSERIIPFTAEVLLVQSGRLSYEISDYDRPGEILARGVAEAGDILVLGRVTHTFTSLSATRLVEIKQGPYLGLIDKEIL